MPGFELLGVRPWSGGGKTRAFGIVKVGRRRLVPAAAVDEFLETLGQAGEVGEG